LNGQLACPWQLTIFTDHSPRPPQAKSDVQSLMVLHVMHSTLPSQVSLKTFPHGLHSSTVSPGWKLDPAIVTGTLRQGLQIGGTCTHDTLGAQHLGAQHLGAQQAGAQHVDWTDTEV
jgi:hypothetical protein